MAEPFKDNYNKKLVNNLADEILSVYKKFDKKKFVKLVFDEEWENRELKQRMRHITLCLNETFDKPYLEVLEILTKIYDHIVKRS